MAGYVLGLYPEFTCIADRCPATCCSGWKITVDAESYQRFMQISNDGLRQDILGNLVKQDGQFRFVNRANGACGMLDADGLCRIQKNVGEEMLCHTCRKFPRITARISQAISGCHESVWLSLAASCPVVAEAILNGSIFWLWLDELGQLHSLSQLQQTELHHITGMPVMETFTESVWRASDFFDGLVDLAFAVLEVLVCFRGIPYLDDSFDLYEMETPDLVSFSNFFDDTEKTWQTFVQQYTYYRYPSRFMEFQTESSNERQRQIQGELCLIRMMLCSRYVLRGSCVREDWLEILPWVYRFSAHGQKFAEKIHQLFSSWNQEILQTAFQNVCLGHE